MGTGDEIEAAIQALRQEAEQAGNAGLEANSPFAVALQARVAVQLAIVNAQVAKGTARP
jgi:hypothetical protein